MNKSQRQQVEMAVKAGAVAGFRANLDTLAQLVPGNASVPQGLAASAKRSTSKNGGGSAAPFPVGSARETLSKRARARHFSYALAQQLSRLPDSSLTYSYQSTLHCCAKLTQKDGKLTGEYCNQRWCMVCNRIRVAKCMNGYRDPLSKLKDPYFLTLTIPNMCRYCLPGALRGMVKTWQLIMKRLRKMGLDPAGIRKLETTYNHPKRNFHPHFHFIIDGRLTAHLVLRLWLEYYPESVRRAQDLRKCDTGSMQELFKYFTKIITYPKGLKAGINRARRAVVYLQALDIIFTAMRGYRVFQPFGIRKDVTESIEGITALQLDESCSTITQVNYEPIERTDSDSSTDDIAQEMRLDGVLLHTQVITQRVWYWSQLSADWVDFDTGELLSGNSPTVWVSEFFRLCVVDSG